MGKFPAAVLTAALALFILVGVSTHAPPPATALGPAPPRYKQGELIVRYREGAKSARVRALHKAVLVRSFGRIPLEHVRLTAGVSVSQALKEYRADPDVLYAEPNYLVRKSSIPNDTFYRDQWNLPLISAPAAWDRANGSGAANPVVVAVLDTGIAYSHPDLVANLWTNRDEIPGNGIDDDGDGIVDDYFGANFGGEKRGDPWDDDTADSHGTHVAGIIGAAGNNGTGISGVDWGVRIMAVKFLHGPEGYGELSDALLAMEYALAHGAKIINCSFEVDDDPSLGGGIRSLREAVEEADRAGALVISAAGNRGLDLDRSDVYPASIRVPNNIAVGAVTRGDALAGYSNYGRHVVDLTAPGGISTGTAEAILSTVWLDRGERLYRTTAGTSMAAPHVTGAAALIWNAEPGLSAYQVKARLLNGIDPQTPYRQQVTAGGRLNLERSLSVGDLPTVFGAAPFRVREGTRFTVSGANFGSETGELLVGNVAAPILSWSDKAITAVAPASSGENGLTVNGRRSGVTLVYPAPPSLRITANPEATTVPGSAVFTLEIGGTETRIVDYQWDLGDGSYSRISGVTTSVSREFAAPGSYLVKARVADDLGRVAESSLRYAAEDGSSPKSGCFIATAAYGSYLHPKVQTLRGFRDRVLLKSAPGRELVRLYYRHSPPLARIVERHEALKVLGRLLLTPLVFVVDAPFFALLLCGGLALLARVRRYLRGGVSWMS